MSRTLRLLPVALFAALAGLFLIGLYGRPPSTIPSVLIGKDVPAFTLPPVGGLAGSDGRPLPGLGAADLRGKGVTVVNVFASWCAPCRDEHPQLMALARAGIRLVGINYKDDPENARRFLGSLGNPYSAVGADVAGRTAVDWGVYGVPESFVVDDKGTIRFKQIGPISPEQLASVVLPQIAAAARPR
jgi:cytochrome c biogenesis protein CcmG, thiol:disulfide interchange protein DsbE